LSRESLFGLFPNDVTVTGLFSIDLTVKRDCHLLDVIHDFDRRNPRKELMIGLVLNPKNQKQTIEP
jgi:hypothetical protein